VQPGIFFSMCLFLCVYILMGPFSLFPFGCSSHTYHLYPEYYPHPQMPSSTIPKSTFSRAPSTFAILLHSTTFYCSWPFVIHLTGFLRQTIDLVNSCKIYVPFPPLFIHTSSFHSSLSTNEPVF
jgi:hypothetical protein